MVGMTQFSTEFLSVIMLCELVYHFGVLPVIQGLI